VRGLLGDGIRDVRASTGVARLAVTDSAEEFRAWWKRNYGPVIAAYAGLADDPGRTAELDAALLDHLERTRSGDHWDAEYLVVTAVRT
jgi:hypothetical protein